MVDPSRPSAPPVSHFKVGGPLSRRAPQGGWTASIDNHGVFTRRPTEPRPARLPPELKVLPASDMKRMHLVGNQGVISNPQPCVTDNVKSHLAVPPAHPKPEPDMRLPAEVTLRKAFDQSSQIMQSPRMVHKSTLSPRQELFSESWGKFPFQDSVADHHVKRKPQVASDNPAPTAAKKSPRACFEPPARMGACFRRKTERNYSDLFAHSPPLSPGRRGLPRADANQLSLSFQDSRTEIARRNGEFRPLRMRSAEQLVSSCKSAGSPANSYKDLRFAKAEIATVGGDEGSQAFQDESSPKPAWWLKSPRPSDRSFDLADGDQGSTVKRLHSTASEARLRYEDDMAGFASGAAFAGFADAARPPNRGVVRSKVPSPPPVIGLSPRGWHPRSPRARTYGDRRGGGSDDDMESLGCKAVARERFRRQMSSDALFLFDEASSL